MKVKIAIGTMVVLFLIGYYKLMVFMGCWDVECQNRFHPGIAITTVAFGLFMLCLAYVMKKGTENL